MSVGNFFIENTPTVFGTEFADATLVNFVKPNSARQRLMQARTSREEGNLVDAIVQATRAFYEVVEGPLEQIGPVRLGRASLSRVKTSRVRSQIDRLDHEASRPLEAMKDALEELRDEVEGIASTVEILSLGLNPHRFARFRSMTPIAMKTEGGPYQVIEIGVNLDRTSKGDVDFCMSFVIETAVTLADLQP